MIWKQKLYTVLVVLNHPFGNENGPVLSIICNNLQRQQRDYLQTANLITGMRCGRHIVKKGCWRRSSKYWNNSEVI